MSAAHRYYGLQVVSDSEYQNKREQFKSQIAEAAADSDAMRGVRTLFKIKMPFNVYMRQSDAERIDAIEAKKLEDAKKRGRGK